MQQISPLAQTIGSRFLAVILVAFLSGGCASFPKPTAHVTGVRISELRLDSATLLFDVAVDNPYSVELPLSNLDYSLASAGKPFLSGQAPVQGTVPANGSTTVSLPARMDFAPLFAALQDIKPGAVIPYDAKLKLSVKAPIIGNVSIPLDKSGQLPIPAIPVIELADVQWKGLDFNRTEAILHLHIVNTNQFALDLTHISLGLTLAGKTIASTDVDQPTSLLPGGEGYLEIPVGFSPKDLGLSAFQLFQGKGSDYRIKGLVAANSPYGPLSLPYEKTGQTTFKTK